MKRIRPFAVAAVFAVSLGIGVGASAIAGFQQTCCNVSAASVNPTLITQDATNHKFIVTPSVTCASGGQYCIWRTHIVVKKQDTSGLYLEVFDGECDPSFPCGQNYNGQGCSWTYTSAGNYHIDAEVWDQCPNPDVLKASDSKYISGVSYP